MGFIDSYKHLEKLCGEVLNDERKLSSYIDEMISKPRGSYLVRGWDDDLKQLKHYRHIRNQIAHEPGCSEDNMCDLEDASWLDNFYGRIMNQTDPLTLYDKATSPRPVVKQTQTYTPTQPIYTYPVQKPKRRKSVGWIATLLILALIVIMFFALKSYIA